MEFYRVSYISIFTKNFILNFFIISLSKAHFSVVNHSFATSRQKNLDPSGPGEDQWRKKIKGSKFEEPKIKVRSKNAVSPYVTMS